MRQKLANFLTIQCTNMLIKIKFLPPNPTPIKKDSIWAARFGHFHRYCQMQINQDHQRLLRHRKVIISMPRCRSFHRIQHIIISMFYIKIITTMRIITLMLACMREISIMIRMYNLRARRIRNLRFPLALTGKENIFFSLFYFERQTYPHTHMHMKWWSNRWWLRIFLN
jgi:hypothetical protein